MLYLIIFNYIILYYIILYYMAFFRMQLKSDNNWVLAIKNYCRKNCCCCFVETDEIPS